MAGKLRVNIAGMDYILTSDSDQVQLEQVASYVDKKVSDVSNNSLSRENKILCASLDIADDMYSLLIKYKKLREDSNEPIKNYPTIKNDYELLTNEYEKIKNEFEKSKSDFMESMKKIDNLNSKINSLNQEIDNKNKKIESKDNNLKKLRENLSKLQEENLDLNKKVRELERDL